MNVSDLDIEQLHTIVSNVQKILWFNYAKDTWDADKEWKTDTIEFVAGVLEDEDLRPERKEAKKKVAPKFRRRLL